MDACDRYKADKAIFVLQAVTKNTKKCQLCGQAINSTQRLREHITKKHLPPRFQHHCDHPDCEVVCGSEGELNEHKKIHVAKPTTHNTPTTVLPVRGVSLPSLSTMSTLIMCMVTGRENAPGVLKMRRWSFHTEKIRRST